MAEPKEGEREENDNQQKKEGNFVNMATKLRLLRHTDVDSFEASG